MTPRIDLDNFARRIVQDSFTEAMPAYWRQRAEAFDAVPLPDVALACRRHAALLEELGLDEDLEDLIDHELDGAA